MDAGPLSGNSHHRRKQFAAARRHMVVITLVIAAAAVLLTSGELFEPPQPFDEGIAATDSWLVLRGRTPYHDFYCLYGFAEFYLGAAALALFGHSLTVV